MYSISAERSAGWSGLAFLAIAIGSTLAFGGAPPGIDAGASMIGAFLATHHQAVLVSNWLTLPAAAFFLWFAVGVRAHLANAAGPGDGLPLYAISGAIASTVLALASAGFMGVLLLTSVPTDDLPGWWGVYMILGGPIVTAASVLFVFAAAHSMRRHGSASQALALYGYLTAFVGGLSTLSLLYARGPMSPTGWMPVIGLGLFAIWVIATSIWLIRSGRPAATAP